VIYALKQARSADRDRMIKIIQDDGFAAEDFMTLVDLLHKYGGIDYTQKTATAFITTAKAALAGFEPSPTKTTMLDIADYALARRV
jgi:octaprenyl-diphosphate synthase